METIVVPDPGPGEAIVQIQACGVCHTDLHYREGGINDDFPFLLGHEAAGIVESVGEGVTNVKPGDYVILNWRAVCGNCRSCRKGKPWMLLLSTYNTSQKMTLTDGTVLSPALGIGAFIEKTLVHSGQCTPVDPKAPPTAAGLLGCGVMAGLGAAMNTGGVDHGDSVAVFGCGGVGDAAIAGARLAGAAKVIAVDIDDQEAGMGERLRRHPHRQLEDLRCGRVHQVRHRRQRRRRVHRSRRQPGRLPTGVCHAELVGPRVPRHAPAVSARTSSTSSTANVRWRMPRAVVGAARSPAGEAGEWNWMSSSWLWPSRAARAVVLSDMNLPQALPLAFFSYAREDSDFALRLPGDLKAAGAAVWLDQLDIQPGQRWDRAVEEALTQCVRMLVVLTPAAVNSANVMDEVSFALEEGKNIIPIIHRDCAIPFRLRRLQHLDFREDYARALNGLVRALVSGTETVLYWPSRVRRRSRRRALDFTLLGRRVVCSRRDDPTHGASLSVHRRPAWCCCWAARSSY